MKMINFTKKKNEVINKGGVSIIQKYRKARDNFHHIGEYRDTAHSICNLKDSMPKKILQFFIMDQTMIFHFIIKELM